MDDWRVLFEHRQWNEIEDLWPHLSPAEQGALLKALQDAVPFITVTDGLESMERHCLPKEAPAEWKGAAKILALGELEAAVEGDPPQASEAWQVIRAEAENFLQKTLGACANKAQQNGPPGELSQEQHCRESLQLLAALDVCATWMRREMKSEADKAWLAEVIAEVASHAFMAGRHMQEAWGKPFESHALRGIKTIEAAAEGGRNRKGKRSSKSAAILAEMQKLIDAGHSKARAAELAAQKGLGASKEANIKLYGRSSAA